MHAVVLLIISMHVQTQHVTHISRHIFNPPNGFEQFDPLIITSVIGRKTLECDG